MNVRRYFSEIVGAGLTVMVAGAGNQFYLTAASGPLWIKPDKGSYSLFYSATGDNVPGGFSELWVNNPTAFPVTFQMVTGDGEFIDKRQLPSTQPYNVVKGSSGWFATVSGGSECSLPDLSGQSFTDVDGKKWLAIQRLYISAQNVLVTAGSQLNLIAGEDGNLSAFGMIQLAYGQPAIQLPVSGNYYVYTTANIAFVTSEMLVFEVYQAIPEQKANFVPPS